MKKWIQLFTLVMFTFIFSTVTVHAKSDFSIRLIDQPLVFYGPSNQQSMTYSVDGTATTGELQLYFSHSPILISPSSLTVKIDGEMVDSIQLNNSKEVNLWTIPLNKKQTTLGKHEISLAFDGTIKEGVCVEQGTNGNWMTIHPQSHVEIKDFEKTSSLSLNTFRKDFTGTKEHPTRIVIPDQASAETYSSALQVAALLSSDSENISTTSVIYEKDWKPTKQSTVIIGVPDDFKNDSFKQSLDTIQWDNHEQSLFLSRQNIKEQDVTLILAKNEAQLEQLLPIILYEPWARQLAGDEMWIDQLPQLLDEQSVFTLKELAIPQLNISSSQPASSNYFQKLPYALNEKDQVVFHLSFQKSSLLDVIHKEKNKKEQELVLHINDKMYPIDLTKIEQSEEYYQTTVEVSASDLSSHRYFYFSITANGFNERETCLRTDKDLWVTIDEERSTIEYPQPLQHVQATTFKQLPFPFTNEPTTLVFSPKRVTDEVLITTIQQFLFNDSGHSLKIRTPDQLIDADKQQHLIVLQPDKEWVEKLASEIEFTNQVPQLHAMGFVQEAARTLAWLTENPWNSSTSALVVQTVQPNQILEDKLFIGRVINELTDANIAVQTSSQTIESNALAKAVAEDKEIQESWIIAGIIFGLILILAIILLFRAIRKKKKDVND